MKFEKEVTVEIDISLEELHNILKNNNFKLKEEYDLEDIYMISSIEKNEIDPLKLLSKCVLLRNIIEKDKSTQMLTYKYKEYNDKEEITKNGKIKCIVDDLKASKDLFERLGFESLIKINDHISVFYNDSDEIAIQEVNGKHVYIEVEEGDIYNSEDDMKNVFSKYSIPIKNNDFFVKKAVIELSEQEEK